MHAIEVFLFRLLLIAGAIAALVFGGPWLARRIVTAHDDGVRTAAHAAASDAARGADTDTAERTHRERVSDSAIGLAAGRTLASKEAAGDQGQPVEWGADDIRKLWGETRAP